jgi:hypothetical protein
MIAQNWTVDIGGTRGGGPVTLVELYDHALRLSDEVLIKEIKHKFTKISTIHLVLPILPEGHRVKVVQGMFLGLILSMFKAKRSPQTRVWEIVYNICGGIFWVRLGSLQQ